MNNELTSKLVQSLEGLTDTIANNEKEAVVNTAINIFQTKLEAKISQARNEAVIESQHKIREIAIAHQNATAQYLSNAILESEKQAIVAQPVEIEWGLEPIDMTKSLAEARQAEDNMRLIGSQEEAESWVNG